MTAYSRDNRDVLEFATDFAAARGLTPDQTTGLAQRLSQMLDWLKSFRRALGYAGRYNGDPAQVRPAMEACAEIAVRYARFWGPMTFVVRPTYTETVEGYRFPGAVETEVHAHTFLPLFRDGIRSISLLPQVGVREHELLLRVLTERLRNDDGDLFNAIWADRLPGIVAEVWPALTPRVAAALFVRRSDDARLSAYTRTFEAFGPFDSGVEARPVFTGDALDALAPQGIDPERARAFLAAADARAALPPLTEDARARVRALFAHGPDREARLAAIQRRAPGPRA